MSDWEVFRYRDEIFDLAHLNPFEHEFVQPAKEGKPERSYRVRVRFSHHCFTQGEPGEDSSLIYRGSLHDRRSFSRRRWALSKRLPELVRGLMDRTIFHTHHGNFFAVELVDEAGGRVEYEVYFKVSRIKHSPALSLVVTSAFPRDPDRLSGRPRAGRIGLAVILHNTQGRQADQAATLNGPLACQRPVQRDLQIQSLTSSPHGAFRAWPEPLRAGLKRRGFDAVQGAHLSEYKDTSPRLTCQEKSCVGRGFCLAPIGERRPQDPACGYGLTRRAPAVILHNER